MAAYPVNASETSLGGFLDKSFIRVADEKGGIRYLSVDELNTVGNTAGKLRAKEFTNMLALEVGRTSGLFEGEWSKQMNERKFYIVYVVQNGPFGKAAAETVAVIAESSEQAKLIAVHSGGYDPLTHIFFVQQLGAMPEYYEDEEE